MEQTRGGRYRPLLSAVLVCVLLAVGCGDSAADEAVGDRLADRLVESLRARIRDRDRRDLPLPGDELLVEVDPQRLVPDDRFRVELIDDLVIGGRGDDIDYLFGPLDYAFGFSLNRIAVDDRGRIFVLPWLRRAARVSVYGSDGEHLYSFARWGQGPGDLQYPRWLVVAGNRVLVFHRNTDWSIWGTEGTYLRDQRIFPEVPRQELRGLKPSKRVLAAHGVDDGSMVLMSPGIGLNEIRNPMARARLRASRFDPTGREMLRYFEVSERTQPRIAVSASGEIYASFVGSRGGRYYLVSWTPDGRPRWYTVLEPIDGDARWAELRLDDAGRLYVMPSYRPFAPDDPRRPVHVFTTEGSFVGSGYLNRRPERLHWQAARDGKAYGVRRNDATREWNVVRYRVELSSAQQ